MKKVDIIKIDILTFISLFSLSSFQSIFSIFFSAIMLTVINPFWATRKIVEREPLYTIISGTVEKVTDNTCCSCLILGLNEVLK